MSNQLNLMRARLERRGGKAQQDRMIKDKRETLDRVLLYSYQGAQVKKINSDNVVRALINPNKVKQDYDDKIISIGFEHGIAPGDVFEWINTGTKWLVYLQDLTELAYFKGDIRKCNYSINWNNENGEFKTTYAAIRGPVETKINFIQKNEISLDIPNHSLNILLPKNEDTLKYFKRYSKFYLQGIDKEDTPICWRIEAIDTISMPGILQVNAVEYYSNEFEDDIENGLVDGLVGKPIVPEPSASEILGEVFIKPKKSYSYNYSGNEEGTWEVIAADHSPIESKIDGKSITITWQKTYSGQFVLKYGNSEKTIVVESLF